MKNLYGMTNTEVAIERLKTFEPQEGYYVAFSGGKDSIVILDLVRKSGVKHDVHFNITTVDPPELMRFIRNYYPEVQYHRPEKTMWDLIVEKRMPPTRIVRYCCEYLKERGGYGRIIITGVRWQESAKRSKRKMVEHCFKDKTKRYLNVIIDWSDRDVWDYIKENNLPYCSLYDEGFKRIGCIGCPMAREGRIKEFARWPRFKNQYLKTFQRCIDKRKADGLQYDGEFTKWDSGQAMFDWWMKDRHKKTDESVLFE